MCCMQNRTGALYNKSSLACSECDRVDDAAIVASRHNMFAQWSQCAFRRMASDTVALFSIFEQPADKAEMGHPIAQ